MLVQQYQLTIPQAAILTCIANEESNFSLTATHINNNGTTDHGLFQINDIWLDKCEATTTSILSTHKNISCAILVHEIQGFTAWSTYRRCK